MKNLLAVMICLLLCNIAAAQDDEKAGRFLANCSWIAPEGHEIYGTDTTYKGLLMQFAIAVKINAAGLPEKVALFDKDQALDRILSDEVAIAEIIKERSAFKDSPSSVIVCYVTVQNMGMQSRNQPRNWGPAVRVATLKTLQPHGPVKIIDPFIIAIGGL